MTERENFQMLLDGKIPEWIPTIFKVYGGDGTSLLHHQGVPGVGGKDFFGVTWLVTPDTGNQAIPSPYEHILDDITKWREVVKFPDLDAMDWEAAAKKDLENFDRNKRFFAANCGEGCFNRLEALMGIENAIYAMFDEPEAVYEFFDAYSDFKIKTMEKLKQYYGLEIYINGDDVCTSEGLMVTMEMYENLIHPMEKKMAKAAIDMGLIVDHHCCGKCDEIIDYIVDTGARLWQPAQHMNDLVGIKAKYGDRLIIHGGWDSTGPHTYATATKEEVEAEVHRCVDTYAKGGGYAFFPIILGDRSTPEGMKGTIWAIDEMERYSREFYKNPANR